MPAVERREWRRWTENEDKILLAIAERRAAGLPAATWTKAAQLMGRDLSSLRARVKRLERGPLPPTIPIPKPPTRQRACNACGRRFKVTAERTRLCHACYVRGYYAD